MVAFGTLSKDSKQRNSVSSVNEFSSASFPVDSLLNSLNVVKEAIAPIESGIQRAVKDLEFQFLCSKTWISNADLDFFSRNGEILNKEDGRIRGYYCTIKKQAKDLALVEEKRKRESLPAKGPLKELWGMVFDGAGNNRKGEALRKRYDGNQSLSVKKEDDRCSNCLHFALTWSLLFNNFVHSIPSSITSLKKCFRKPITQEIALATSSNPCNSCSSSSFTSPTDGGSCGAEQLRTRDEDNCSIGATNKQPLEIFIAFVFDHATVGNQKNDPKCGGNKGCSECEPLPQIKQCGGRFGVAGKRSNLNSLISNLRFARIGGVPSMAGVDSVKDDDQEDAVTSSEVETSTPQASTPQKIAASLLQIPLSNVERLRSTISAVSLTELVEVVTQLKRSSNEYPDKKKLFSVQEFFKYTESEGRRFFEKLDRDGDGQVTLEDLEIVMRKRRLPHRYARDFMHRIRSHLFAKSFGWNQFLSFMEQKEPTILRAYTTLCLSKSGTLQKNQLLASLKSAGLPANEENAVAMLRFLNADAEDSISYGHFRNFMLLLPSNCLQDDSRNIWFEAATVVAVPPPVEIPAGSVLKSALAGGLSCALSTSIMHPVDTIKTRVQASTLSFPELISKLPEIGVRGLYRGSIPAIIGQFSSHGLRTGIFEASKLLLIHVAPTLPEIQVRSLASFCSTVLGTAVRIPCEVMKQRLQAGIFDNAGQALVGTMRRDGLKGFFRGTGATLCREVPFYVAGMGLYEELKKTTQHILRRELEPWETIVVGAVSGGVASVLTTPFDVMKTRMMTAPQGVPVTMTSIAFSILQNEGPLGLFKGAVPRFFWIAPLGAMNFAGYELARKAMNKRDNSSKEQSQQKLLVKAR